jgi:hypothetical protein
MVVSINQPAYLPWLGYYHRIALSDVFVLLNHVQFEKNSFTNRNKIRTAQGWCWLTIPLKTSGKFGELNIDSIQIEESNWTKKHLETIRMNYSKCTYFNEYFPQLSELYQQKWTYLSPMLEEMNQMFLGWLGIKTRILKSSDLGIESKKSDLVLDICKFCKADTYFSGSLGRNYLNQADFRSAGIEVVFQEYHHPVYSQRYPGFESYMGIVDLLMNHGKDSLNILMEGNNQLKMS